LFAALCIGLCVAWRLVVLTPARVGLCVAAAVGLLAVLPEAVWQRALSPQNYLPENSYNLRGRFELWASALRVIDDYWLTGVGGANWWIIPKYIRADEMETDAIMSHNEYLQTFIDTGIFGWIFFVAFIVAVFVYAVRTAMQLRRDEGESDRYWFMIACQACLLVVYLFGMQVDVFHNPLKGWWLVAGLVCVMHRLCAAERTRQPLSMAAEGDRT
ncbi:MAG TPA: O-antigen ligase family protein, partial [Casimicrobiaceae bacterium]|nr:O-antigen ligase family protein [Casimicrobiaceae bacterium]